MNKITEQIRQYLISGGAGNIVKALNIGIKVVTKETVLLPIEEISQRFVWLDGERKGNELTIDEIRGIGCFLNMVHFMENVVYQRIDSVFKRGDYG